MSANQIALLPVQHSLSIGPGTVPIHPTLTILKIFLAVSRLTSLKELVISQ